MDFMDDGKGVRAAFVEPVFVNCIYASPTLERLERLAEFERGCLKHGKRMAIVCLIDPRVGREMTSEAREYAKNLSNEMDPHTVLMLFVVSGAGFFSAMARSVIAGIQLFTRRPYTWRVVSELEEGMRWLPEELARQGLTVDTAMLDVAVRRCLRGDAQ